MDNKTVGAIDVRSARQSAKLKLSSLAQLAGVEEYDLKQLERGLAMPDSKFFRSVATVLGVDADELAEAHSLLYRNPKSGEGYVTNQPAESCVKNRRANLDPQMLGVVDLFCGVGGFSHGFELTQQFQVISGVDLLSDRLETFSENHLHATAIGQDIRTLEPTRLCEGATVPHVVVGGPPCQGYSSIRPFRNDEHNDERNSLFYDFCRIISEIRPKWIVFENVVGLVTHRGGDTLKEIIDSLSLIGYKTSAKVLNAVYYGLPQRRERLIIVGSLEHKEFRWPQPTHYYPLRTMVKRSELLLFPEQDGLFGNKNMLGAVSVEDAIGDLPMLNAGESASSYQSEPHTPYQKFIRNFAKKLTLHESTAHSEKMLEIIKHAGLNINALPPGLVSSGFSSCYSRLEADQPSVTLTVNFVHPASNRCIHPAQNRALTPREGARLQGFPDTFEFFGNRSQIVKQIGNAVPPLLGRVIAEAILTSE